MFKSIDKIYYQMATLLDAGLPITRSLETVAQGQKGRLKKAITFVNDQVSCGSQIHEAMEKKRRIFAPLDITMVAAAEDSGNLTATFKMLADWYDLQVKLRRAGRPMYKGFSRQLLPVELYSLWETGEESGMLDTTAEHLAKMYEERAIFGFQQFIFWLPKIAFLIVMLYEIYLIARNVGYIYSHGAAI